MLWETIVGIFDSRGEGERAVGALKTAGIAGDRITLLAPGTADQLTDVRTTEAEQPGMGKALGATVGGALGVAGGAPLGAAIASFFVPGVGPDHCCGIVGCGHSWSWRRGYRGRCRRRYGRRSGPRSTAR